MRSLRLSPTSKELDAYLKANDGRLTFAELLEVLHSHGTKEKPAEQIRAAFRALDTKGTGHVPIAELEHVLCRWGCEPLDNRSLQRLLREANAKGPYVEYEQIVRLLTAPTPDY
jgi:Ca2+-binding EF-hand superfamily protein